MAIITYANKEDGALDETGEVSAANMNMIKSVVNANAANNVAQTSITEEIISSGNPIIILAHNYIPGSLRVFRNGVRLPMASYMLSSANTYTIDNAPDAGDIITTDYKY